MSCTLTMQNLAQAESCENNISGVKTIYVCPLEHVSAINATPAASLSDFESFVTIGSSTDSNLAVSCVTGKKFGKIHSVRDLGELKYVVQGAVGSRSLKATLEIFHASFKKKLLGFVGSLMNQEMLVVAVLNNGEIHLLGKMDDGAIFSDGLETTSGKAKTDQNGATLQFEWDCAMPQVFYDTFNPESTTNGIQLSSGASA